ncbi:hypothetical protein TcCL_NonESM12283, partial [Trypanosoma cruzi]
HKHGLTAQCAMHTTRTGATATAAIGRHPPSTVLVRVNKNNTGSNKSDERTFPTQSSWKRKVSCKQSPKIESCHKTQESKTVPVQETINSVARSSRSLEPSNQPAPRTHKFHGANTHSHCLWQPTGRQWHRRNSSKQHHFFFSCTCENITSLHSQIPI